MITIRILDQGSNVSNIEQSCIKSQQSACNTIVYRNTHECLVQTAYMLKYTWMLEFEIYLI